MRWLLWAAGLLAITCVADIAAFAAGTAVANARPVREAGVVVMMLLGGYLLVAVAATAFLWQRGKALDAGMRTVGTIAFLIGQGLLFAFLSLATLLGTNR